MVESLPPDVLTAPDCGRRRLSRREIDALQLRLLSRTLEYARERSRFYAKRLPASPPASLEELRELPFTTERDIAERPEALLCVHPSRVSRVVTLPTSGTTGKPKRLFFTEADIERCLDFFDRGMRHITRPGDRVGVLFPTARESSVGELLLRALPRSGCLPEPFEADRAEVYDVLVGPPSLVEPLTRDKPRACPRAVLLSAEYVSRGCREAVSRVWGAEVFEHYGMTEMGLGCAVSCSANMGYHWRETDLLLEIVDPVTGLALADGEYGEIVFTTLSREAMPLIRYKTGDRSRIIPEPCACGGVLRLLERVGDRGLRKGEGSCPVKAPPR